MNRGVALIIVVVLAALVANASLIVVKETERAVKLRFGRLIEEDIAPGLHWKWPLADDVRKFDARVLTLDAPTEDFLTVQNKRLKVDSFAKWRIEDVGTYYRSTGGNEDLAQSRLASRVNDGLRNQFGTRTLHEVVSGERDLLMRELQDKLNETVFETLGVRVVDIRVKRIDLPEEVSGQVFQRMTAEREKEARNLRAQGQEQAEKIRAAADREKTVILANAYSQAEQVRGEGDARATSIYADAYTKDPEFYAFLRSLSAYKQSFRDKSDVLLVDPKSEFFRYLQSDQGGR